MSSSKLLIVLILLRALIFTRALAMSSNGKNESSFSDEGVSVVIGKLMEIQQRIDTIEQGLRELPALHNALDKIKGTLEDLKSSQTEITGKKIETLTKSLKEPDVQQQKIPKFDLEVKEGSEQNSERYDSPVGKTCDAKENDLRNDLRSLNNTMIEVNRIAHAIKDLITPRFESCEAALKSQSSNGVYKLHMPHSDIGAFYAYCKYAKDYSAWIVIQRRSNNMMDFERDWNAYKHGFGDPDGDYWLGLEKIHALTSAKRYMLYVLLTDSSGKVFGRQYTQFEIGRENEGFYLKKSVASSDKDILGEAGTERTFLTYDRASNCGNGFAGAWWYKNCRWSGSGVYNSTINGNFIDWSKSEMLMHTYD